MLLPLSRTQSPSNTQLQRGWKALLLKPRAQQKVELPRRRKERNSGAQPASAYRYVIIWGDNAGCPVCLRSAQKRTRKSQMPKEVVVQMNRKQHDQQLKDRKERKEKTKILNINCTREWKSNATVFHPSRRVIASCAAQGLEKQLLLCIGSGSVNNGSFFGKQSGSSC